MINRFISKINKHRLNIAVKITAFVFAIVCIFNIIDITYSRYESNANMDIRTSIAFFIINQGTYERTITLDDMEPSSDPYVYTIYVKNFDGSARTNVDLTYHVTFTTTTNLPITLEIYRNTPYEDATTSEVNSPVIVMDDDVYYKEYTTTNDYSFGFTADQTDYYTIAVHYPEIYKNYPDLYQGKIELLTVRIDAEQVV